MSRGGARRSARPLAPSLWPKPSRSGGAAVHSLSPFGGREPALSELLGPNAELVARFRRFAAARRPGLVLVVGPAGSGRGLVLRALAQEILPERTKGDTDASLADLQAVRSRLEGLSRWAGASRYAAALSDQLGGAVSTDGQTPSLARQLYAFGGRGYGGAGHGRISGPVLLLGGAEGHPMGRMALYRWLPRIAAEGMTEWVFVSLEAQADGRSPLESAIVGRRYPEDPNSRVLVFRAGQGWDRAAVERLAHLHLDTPHVSTELLDELWAAVGPWGDNPPAAARILLDHWRRAELIENRAGSWELTRPKGLLGLLSGGRGEVPNLEGCLAPLLGEGPARAVLLAAAWAGPFAPWDALRAALDPSADPTVVDRLRDRLTTEHRPRLWRMSEGTVVWRDHKLRDLIFRVSHLPGSPLRAEAEAAVGRALSWLAHEPWGERARWSQPERCWSEALGVPPIAVPVPPTLDAMAAEQSFLSWLRFGPPLDEQGLSTLVERLDPALAAWPNPVPREELWRTVMERSGATSPSRARALHMLGQLLRTQGRLAEAEGLLRHCLDTVTVPERTPGERVSAQAALGLVLLALRRTTEAEERLRRAVNEAERGQVAPLELATMRLGLARTVLLLGRLGEADPLLRRSVEELVATGAPASLVSSARHDLAKVRWMQGRAAEALRILRMSIRDGLREGAGRDDLARMRADLGGWLLETGDLAEAEVVLREAADRGGPSEDPGRAPLLLGRALMRQGRFTDAEVALRKSIGERRKVGSPQSEVLQPRMELVACVRLQGRTREAEVLLRRWIANSRDWAGPAEASRMYHQLALTAVGQGQVEEAEVLFRTALEYGVEADVGPGTTALIRHGLGALLIGRGQMSEAAAELRRALFDLRSGAKGDEVSSNPTLTARDRDRFQQADQLLRASLEEMEDAGGHSSQRALTWQLLAQLAFERGHVNEAADLARRAEMDLLGYLEQLREADPFDARLRGCLAALRDNANMRGEEEEAEYWATELQALAGMESGIASVAVPQL